MQLREKTLDEAAFVKEGQELLELCHHYNVPLIINDNVKLAKKSMQTEFTSDSLIWR